MTKTIQQNVTTNSNDNSFVNTTGRLLVGITGGIAVTLTVICTPFILPALRKYCLPYIPATSQQIENVFKALKGRNGGNLLDLGSGDGRIVLEAAKNNFQAHGIELNPILVFYSRLKSIKMGLWSRTKFFINDLWKFNLNNYDNIVIFGVEQMMNELEKKILMECKQNCHIIACRFPLPNKKPIKIIGFNINKVWLYKI